MDDKSVSQDKPRPTISRDQTGPGRLTSVGYGSGTGGCDVAMGGCEVAIAEPRLAAPPACSAYTDLLVDLSDGELPFDQQPAVRDHVATCPGCQAELARLDASLVRLANGIATGLGGRGSRSEPRLAAALRHAPVPNRRLHLVVAATSLTCLLGISWFAWHSAAHRVATMPAVETKTQPLLSSADALRQIALVEQCARLQTSLNLMPDDPTYADQRATNERLLVKFQEAAANAAPRTENGETL